MGLIDVIKKIPSKTDKILGIIIIEKLDLPEILIAVSSSVLFILRKNIIPEIKITNG